MKKQRSGPQAMRVPFEAFAGEPDLRAVSRYCPPLELVVNAAERTGEYRVFEAPLIEILVDWKWKHFARAAFLREMALYVVHLVLVILWSMEATETAHLTIADLLGRDPKIGPKAYLLFLWGWTTMMVFVFAYTEWRKLRDVGLGSYLRNVYSLLDACYILLQGTVNVLFWARDLAPVLMYVINDYPLALNYTLDVYGGLETTVYGAELRRAGAPADVPLARHRLLKAVGSAGGGELTTSELTGWTAGWFMSLQALVILFSFLRLLYFFRANLEFGALVHMVMRVMADIIPMTGLLAVIIFGFSFSLLVLLQCELGEQANIWHDPSRALLIVLNMGLYTYSDLYAFGTRSVSSDPSARAAKALASSPANPLSCSSSRLIAAHPGWWWLSLLPIHPLPLGRRRCGAQLAGAGAAPGLHVPRADRAAQPHHRRHGRVALAGARGRTARRPLRKGQGGTDVGEALPALAVVALVAWPHARARARARWPLRPARLTDTLPALAARPRACRHQHEARFRRRRGRWQWRRRRRCRSRRRRGRRRRWRVVVVVAAGVDGGGAGQRPPAHGAGA